MSINRNQPRFASSNTKIILILSSASPAGGLTDCSGLNDSEYYVNIEATRTGPTVILKVIGRMDAVNAPAFEDTCKSWVDQGVSQIIVDMSELSYVSSMGLRSFVLIGKMTQEKHGALRLCRCTGLVKQVFEITRLNSVFPMHESVEAALASV